MLPLSLPDMRQFVPESISSDGMLGQTAALLYALPDGGISTGALLGADVIGGRSKAEKIISFGMTVYQFRS